ncbi:MAG: FG-GAP repeat protein [Xanthomonadales bacterium]|nr:FG-GAP repeat protein [Xanthomonadales bacterium]
MAAPVVMAGTTGAGQSQTILAGQVPQGISSGDWKNIQDQIQAKQYQSYPDNHGGFNASNRAHNWKIRFQDSGTTSLSSKTDNSYQIDMKLTALGYQQLVSVDYPTQVTSKGNITTYQWSPELREIWTNTVHSLEQWFVLEQRSARSNDKSKQKLQLKLSLDTGLSINQKPGGLYFSNQQGIEISYTKLKVWDKNGTIMPSKIMFADNIVSLQIDDSQAQYPLTIDPLFQQQAYLKASNSGVDDSFGGVVAVSGDTVVVGAFGEDSSSTGVDSTPDELASFAGAAYVFTRSGVTWSQQAYLKASNADNGDWFGWSVAVSGDTVVVGAVGEDSSSAGVDSMPDESASSAGAAYVFSRSGVIWSQQAYLKASNADYGDMFGSSVAASGDTIVLGARLEDSSTTAVDSTPNNSADDAGAAYVFILDTTPVASGVSFTGTAVVGEQLTGGYIYSDADNDLEGNTTFRWLRDGAPIVGATGTSYTLVAADTGTTIIFEVTPVAATGASPGAPAISGESITIRSQALFSDSFE